jgi:hypothetical protein
MLDSGRRINNVVKEFFFFTESQGTILLKMFLGQKRSLHSGNTSYFRRKCAFN